MPAYIYFHTILHIRTFFTSLFSFLCYNLSKQHPSGSGEIPNRRWWSANF